MAERSMAVVLKTTEPERVPGVRIPLSPPTFAHLRRLDVRSVGDVYGERVEDRRVLSFDRVRACSQCLFLRPALMNDAIVTPEDVPAIVAWPIEREHASGVDPSG